MDKTYFALVHIYESEKTGGISCREFASKLWGNDVSKKKLFESSSNTGNGACRGKKAWLCAGSYLGRLIKKGWVYKNLDCGEKKYHLTNIGLEKIYGGSKDIRICKFCRYFQKDFDTLGYCVEGVEHISENTKVCKLFD